MSFVVISECFSYMIDNVLGEPDTRDLTTDLRLFFFCLFENMGIILLYIYMKKTSVAHCRPFSILVLIVPSSNACLFLFFCFFY